MFKLDLRLLVYSKAMSSIDDQLASLEKSIGGSTSLASSAGINLSSSPAAPRSLGGAWGASTRLIVSAVLSGALMWAFRPMWIYSIRYVGEEEEPRKKILWVKAAGAWAGLTALFFVMYHFVLSRYVSVSF